MKHAVALTLVVLAFAPGLARADGEPVAASCEVIHDPIGDVGGAVDGSALAPGVAGRTDGAIDLTTITFATTPDAALVDVAVRDLADIASDNGAVYSVTWDQAGGSFTASVVRRDASWRFELTGPDIQRPIDGTASNDSIRFHIPRALLPDGADGATLADIRAAAHTFPHSVVSPTLVSTLEDSTWIEDVSYALGTTCAPLSDAGAPCLIAEDIYGDGDRSTGSADPALDIVSFSASSNDTAVVFEILVEDLSSLPARAMQRWEITWGDPTTSVEVGRALQGASLSVRTSDGSLFGGALTLDVASDVIRVAVPTRDLAIDDGAVLTDLMVRSSSTYASTLVFGQDDIGYDAGLAYGVGTSCPSGAAPEVVVPPIIIEPVCPVVVDEQHDATPAAGMVAVGDLVRDDALDIEAAGADSAPELLAVTARIVSPRAELPEGTDTVGWTTSWSFGGYRWVAQAKRSPRGERFTLARINRDSSSLSGPLFGGTPTTGSIDDETGVVTIDVPRSMVGAPSDGTYLDAFGAVSWAARDGNPTVYHVFDETRLERYQVGTSCSA